MWSFYILFCFYFKTMQYLSSRSVKNAFKFIEKVSLLQRVTKSGARHVEPESAYENESKMSLSIFLIFDFSSNPPFCFFMKITIRSRNFWHFFYENSVMCLDFTLPTLYNNIILQNYKISKRWPFELLN